MSEVVAGRGSECLVQQLSLTACHPPVTRLNLQLSFRRVAFSTANLQLLRRINVTSAG